MKYVLAEEGVKWRQFWGYIFTPGKSVEITDRGTLEAIKHQPFFKEVIEDAVQQEKVQAPAQAEVLAPEPAFRDKRICPKCGKKFKKNLTMHERFCKG